jgi:hypothetical protein
MTVSSLIGGVGRAVVKLNPSDDWPAALGFFIHDIGAFLFFAKVLAPWWRFLNSKEEAG